MYLLGYDIGSSSVKAALVNTLTGACVASRFFPAQEAPIRAERAGWAEQDPHAWWSYLKDATAAVVADSGVKPHEIAAIGISYQMHGLVLIDRERRVLRDAIIWCDSRGVPYGRRALADLGADSIMPELLNAPGNLTATKLAWVKEYEPELFERVYKILLPGDYIAMRLTGEILTTVEGLSEMMLWDFRSNRISQAMLDYFGFSAELFPDVVPTFSLQGGLTAEAAAELGLAAGTPVCYRAGDQPNNALSLNVFNPGEIASTAGTSGVIYGINDSLRYDPLSRINNFAHVNHTPAAPRIGVMTCISGTGILNSWMKRNVAPAGISYDEMNTLAATAPIGSAGVSILPFGNGAERVLENRDAGCSLHGINFNIHRREHLLRAAQEGIVFALMYGIEVMQGIGLKIDTIHAGEANMFLSPIFRKTLAAVADATIKLFDTDGAIGAARGAGLGLGLYSSPREAFASLHCLQTIVPPADRTPYVEAYERWKAVLES